MRDKSECAQLVFQEFPEDAWKLTDDGEEVCAHPEQLERYLGPRAAALAVQHVQNNTFNAGNMQNTQVGGSGNVINATYSQVLQQLAQEIQDSNATPAEKDALLEKVKALLQHPLTQTAITLGGAALGVGG